MIIISFLAFISLGLPDGLLGVAWPGIRETFNLPIDAIGLILVFSTAGYMTSSFFSGVITRRLGIGILLTISCTLTALSMSTYAFSPIWVGIVFMAFTGGLGAGAIDAGLNTYIAQNHSEKTMQWLHASFGVGVTLGPLIMTSGISLTSRWQTGYMVVAVLQILLALLFLSTKQMWPKTNLEEESFHKTSIIMSLKHTPTLISMVIFLLYTGFELGLGLWIYTILTEVRGVQESIAGFMAGSYWFMFTVGRIFAGFYTKKLSPAKLIYISLIMAITGTTILLLTDSSLFSVIGIGLNGLAIAPVFPALVSDTKNRVGKSHEANAIGMQVASAGLGAAIVPSVAGLFARGFGAQIIPLYLLVVVTLLLILFTLSHTKKVK